jgi:hypothetical protein
MSVLFCGLVRKERGKAAGMFFVSMQDLGKG